MRILIPVDGSTCSRAAVRFIGARSKFMGEKPDVTLLNVQQNIPGTVIEHFSLEAVRSVYEAEGKAIVEKLAPEIEAYGIEPHMAVRIDDCGPAVAKIAVDDNIDLITMGSRGLSPVKSFFLGSVSRSVLEHTTTPVLPCAKKSSPNARTFACCSPSTARITVNRPQPLLPTTPVFLVRIPLLT